jgi:hypothetical protein
MEFTLQKCTIAGRPDHGCSLSPCAVRPELVEGLPPFGWLRTGFDKLRANGTKWSRLS